MASTTPSEYDTTVMERDGLLETLTVMEEYIEEVYKVKNVDADNYGHYTTPGGLTMTLDKLRVRLKMCEEHIELLNKTYQKNKAEIVGKIETLKAEHR